MRTSDAVELVVLAAIWGASFLFMRIAAPELGPVALMALRVGIAASLLVAALALRGGLAALRGRLLHVVVVGAINSTLPFCLLAYATLSMTAGLTSILNATSPLWGALVAHLWLKDRLTRSRTLGLAIGCAGVAFLVWGRASFKARRQRARRRRGAGGDALVRSGRELHPAVPARRRSPRRGGGQPARGDRPAPPGALALWPAHPVRVSADRERQDRRIVNSRIESS